MSKRRSGQASAPKYTANHYSYSINWSDEDSVFIGKVAEFPSLGAHGDTPEAALREIMFVVGEVVKDLARGGEEIPEPFSKRSYSGKLNVRMPPQKHRELAIEAAREHVSLNQLINMKLGGN